MGTSRFYPNVFIMDFCSLSPSFHDGHRTEGGRRCPSMETTEMACCNHARFIFVLLASAIFGSGEKVRVKVTTALDAPIHVGVTDDRKMYELPFTLTLKEFVLEEYPPQVIVVDGKEVVMPRREVKKFLSRVAVTDEEGTKRSKSWSIILPASEAG